MTTETFITPTTLTRAVAGKYLTFLLEAESYGISLLKVREIIRYTDITAVPQTPAYLRGVINLRGKIIAVVDLRTKFGLAARAPAERTCIIVAQLALPSGARPQLGLIVDAVEEVITLAPPDIEDPPDFGASFPTDYILGMAKIKGTVKTLLDLDRVIAADAFEKLTYSGV